MPEFPEEFQHLLGWSAEIASAEPLNHQEIMSWSTLTGSEPTPFEVKMLREIDRIYRTAAQKQK